MNQTQAVGTPGLFDFKGKTYRVAQRSIDHECLFCQWVKREAYNEIERLKDDMPAALYKMHVDGFRHDCAMKLYDWGMPFVTVAAMSPSGSKYLAYLALLELNAGVTEALVDEIYADEQGAWERLCTVMGDLNDPNRKRQAQEPPAA